MNCTLWVLVHTDVSVKSVCTISSYMMQSPDSDWLSIIYINVRRCAENYFFIIPAIFWASLSSPPLLIPCIQAIRWGKLRGLTRSFPCRTYYVQTFSVKLNWEIRFCWQLSSWDKEGRIVCNSGAWRHHCRFNEYEPQTKAAWWTKNREHFTSSIYILLRVLYSVFEPFTCIGILSKTIKPVEPMWGHSDFSAIPVGFGFWILYTKYGNSL